MVVIPKHLCYIFVQPLEFCTSIYSIQNCFIGMTVKNTILPKLEIYGEKYNNNEKIKIIE